MKKSPQFQGTLLTLMKLISSADKVNINELAFITWLWSLVFGLFPKNL